MKTSLAVKSASFVASGGGKFVSLVLNDGSTSGIYLEDGSPRTELHDLLDAWLSDGNKIAEVQGG